MFSNSSTTGAAAGVVAISASFASKSASFVSKSATFFSNSATFSVLSSFGSSGAGSSFAGSSFAGSSTTGSSIVSSFFSAGTFTGISSTSLLSISVTVPPATLILFSSEIYSPSIAGTLLPDSSSTNTLYPTISSVSSSQYSSAILVLKELNSSKSFLIISFNLLILFFFIFLLHFFLNSSIPSNDSIDIPLNLPSIQSFHNASSVI